MAAREFHGVLYNLSDSEVTYYNMDVDSGIIQDPWSPSMVPGAGLIKSNGHGEWRTESNSIYAGTSGSAQWLVNVQAFNEPNHTELVQVNWAVPFYGRPNVTCKAALFDSFNGVREGLTTLEIVPVSSGEYGQAPALIQAQEIAPYVLALPWSWGIPVMIVEHLVVNFELRPRARQAQQPLQFPTGGPSEQVRDAGAFRNRATAASGTSFVGAFPNFYEATYGRDHVGGTVFVKAEGAQWRDVELTQLNNVDLEDFAGRIRATQDYAANNGFVGGFPTFYHAQEQRVHPDGPVSHVTVCGTVLLAAEGAEFRDVPLPDLGNPDLADVGGRFRATNEYARRNGFVGGFPTMNHVTEQRVQIDGPPRNVTVCGTVLIKPDFGEWRDVTLYRDPA